MTAHTLGDAAALLAAVRAHLPETRARARAAENVTAENVAADNVVALDRRANGTVIAKLIGSGSPAQAVYQLRRGEEVLAEARTYCHLIRLIMLTRL